MLTREDFGRSHDGDLDGSVISSLREILLRFFGQDVSFVDMTGTSFPVNEYHMNRRKQCHHRLSCSDIPLEEASHRMRLLHIFEYLEEDNFLFIRERKGESLDECFHEFAIEWRHFRVTLTF
jgi:hypothetical protein